MKLRYSPRARADIADIHDYIAQHNPRAATGVVRSIRATCRLLGRYPGIGRGTDIPDVRMLPVSRYPYLVYHSIKDNWLTIVHVRRGARAVPRKEEL